MTHRTPGQKFISAKRARWNNESDELLLILKATYCKMLDWFPRASSRFLTGKVKLYQSLSFEKRKSVIYSMLGSDIISTLMWKSYGEYFCWKRIRFSRRMQSLVGKTFGVPSVRSIYPLERDQPSSRCLPLQVTRQRRVIKLSAS